MLLPLVLLACNGGAADETIQEVPPLVVDDSFSFALGREWNLIGDALMAGHDTLEVQVTGEGTGDEVLVWLDGIATGALAGAAGGYGGTVDIGGLPAGEHSLLLSADDGETAFAEVGFLRSAPLYTIVSVDWDSADTADKELEWHMELHQAHPHLRLTQLVGPYTFTDEMVSGGRREELVSWLRANESA